MSKNVQIIKFINGEIMIGDVVESGEVLNINNPLQIATVPDGQGQTQMVFVDFNGQLGASDTLEVEKRNVLYLFKAGTEVENSYITRSTGIEIPQEGSVKSLDINDLTN